MKPIIAIVLLLALSQVARGQDTTGSILYPSNKIQFVTIRPHIVDTFLVGSATIPYYRTSKDSNDRPQVIRVVTTADLDEWVDSCWADSTWSVVPCGGHSLLYLECKGWTHRDPNNLTEFMNFIRRKTK